MKKVLLTLLLFSLRFAFGQPGTLDASFNPTDKGFGSGSGPSNTVLATAVQADGKILAGGYFTRYNDAQANYFTRLNSDGTLDASFNAVILNSVVETIDVQPDGKILIGGSFSTVNGIPRSYIARLNSNGSLDASFNPGSGASSNISAMVLQPDGKVLIGGNFTAYNGTARNRIARLNSDGTLDAGFTPGTGANSSVRSLALQGDGKVLIGGSFTDYNGDNTKDYITRLNSDGSPDAGFAATCNGNVLSIGVQPDGKPIIAGDFSTVNGLNTRLARLNGNGSLDAGFAGTGPNSTVIEMVLQPDGKILIGGHFTSVNGTSTKRIARINSDGTLDASFAPGADANNVVEAIALQPNGQVLVGWQYTFFDNTVKAFLTRLNANGSTDMNFNPRSGAHGVAVNAVAVQADGKVYIGGDFTVYNETTKNRIARLNADGTPDHSFTGTGADQPIYAIAFQSDGKILIGGDFQNYNGVSRYNVARLNSDGSLDPSLNTGSLSGRIEAMVVQADGKILVGGSFSTFGGVARNRVARINSDGSLDASFNIGTGTDAPVQAMVLQPDGKVIIGGQFTSYNGTSRNGIARLNSDGSLDASFNIGSGFFNGAVSSLALQPDGKIVTGGSFGQYNGTNRAHIARINNDGSLDASFNPGTGFAGQVMSLALQPNAKVLVVGTFNSFNGTSRKGIARLNTNGTLDAAFDPGTGFTSGTSTEYAQMIVVQDDGKAMIVGRFTSYNGTGRNRVARIVYDIPPTAFNVIGGGSYCGEGSVPVGLNGSETGVSYQLKRDGADVGSPVAGTGSALLLGNFTTAGTYTVAATHNENALRKQMTGSTLVATPPPGVAAIPAGTQVCTSFPGSNPWTVYYSGCDAVARFVPSGSTPLSGTVNGCVTVDAAVQFVGGKPYVQRHVDVSPTVNTATATATVTLYFPQSEFNAFNAVRGSYPALPTGPSDAAGKAALVVSQFGGTGTAPGNYTGSGNLINPDDAAIVWNATANRWEVTFAFTGQSGFFVHTGLAVLPVSLVKFGGQTEGGANKLWWETASETGNKGFDVERSADGVNFSKIGWVDSKAPGGNSAGSLQYAFTDDKPLADKNSYRLKQVDNQGRVAYSGVLRLQGAVVKDLALNGLYPNPATGKVWLTVLSPNAELATIRVTDLAGRELMQQRLGLAKGDNLLPLDVAALAPGVYLVKVMGQGGETAVQKFVKQ